MRIEQEGAYANLLVPQLLTASGLDTRDRAFVTELVYGTTRMRRACDFLVDRFLTRPPTDEVRTLLRLGAYQLAFAGVDAHAAVGETVELAPNNAKGFLNAVLRKVATTAVQWPDDATRLSYPDWIVDRLRSELGDIDAVDALARMNEPPPVTERADGYVQDLASAWVADLVPCAPGELVLDLCAAPGGKATALAGRGARVVAVDLHKHRGGLVRANAKRLGLAGTQLGVVVADGTRAPFRDGAFDHVLLDAPCSGLGALRRRPDARWRIQEADIARLVDLQRDLLLAAQRMVRPGGTITYSACTLTRAEGLDHDQGSLATWEVLPPPAQPWRPLGRGAALVLPHDADTDGMVVLRWRRRPADAHHAVSSI